MMLKSFFCFYLLGICLGISLPREDQTVCYDDLGCFTTAYPWTSDVRPIAALPQDPAIVATTFHLFTRQNLDVGYQLLVDENNLERSPFDGNKRAVFLIHGWTNDGNHSWITSATKELLILEDMNVVIVDWSKGAGYPYLRALVNTQVVGAEIAKLVNFLKSQTPLLPGNVHLVGHNLAAHAAGYAGNRLPDLGRITGLDPARIYFEGGDAVTFLDASDAVLVDVVHTDASHNKHIGFGFSSVVGHVDFLANNGQAQPGCVDLISDIINSESDLILNTDITGTFDKYICSNVRAVEYFVESINSLCPFVSYPCSDYETFLENGCYSTCHTGRCQAMGYHAGQYEARGTFYVKTEDTDPYCVAVYRVAIEVAMNQETTDGTVTYILIGDYGQTKEAVLFKGTMRAGNVESTVVSLYGSGPYSIGNIIELRLRYEDGWFDPNALYIDGATVSVANWTIGNVDTVFQPAELKHGEYVTIFPA